MKKFWLYLCSGCTCICISCAMNSYGLMSNMFVSCRGVGQTEVIDYYIYNDSTISYIQPKGEYLSKMEICSSKERIVAVMYPYSESGDWYCEVHYIFIDGKIAYIYEYLSFFNNFCSDDIVKKLSYKRYRHGELTNRVSYLFDANNRPIRDSSICVINYRIDYPVYLTFDGFPGSDALTSSSCKIW